MNGNPTVASVIAADLAGYGARRCFGLLGTANFKVSHALVAGRRRTDFARATNAMPPAWATPTPRRPAN